jgi:hypothetical protein
VATSLPDCGLGGYAALSLSPCQETITVENMCLSMSVFHCKPETKQKPFYRNFLYNVHEAHNGLKIKVFKDNFFVVDNFSATSRPH